MTADLRADWQTRAACNHRDHRDFFTAQPDRARPVCRSCPVRVQCLHDALTTEAPNGIWGGLTVSERRALPPLPPHRAEALGVLRTLLARFDTDLDERTTTVAQPIPTPPSDTPLKAVPAAKPAVLPVDKLIEWGERHVDPDVQAQASRTRIALTGLRTRYASDLELNQIADEEEKLAARLAELRSRKVELLPARPKGSRKPVDYPAAEVRTWAAANGYECPKTGRVPRAVVEAWRAANKPTNDGDS